MKNIIRILALFVLVISAGIFLAACDKEVENQHTHNYSSWVITLDPTCTEDGSKEKECNVCDQVEIAKINKIGHHFVEGICANCGEIK